MKQICVNEIEPAFDIGAKKDKPASESSALIDTLQLLGSPFSSENGDESPLALPPVPSPVPNNLISDNNGSEIALAGSESDDEFRGKRSDINLLRAKKRGFVFGDSSDSEPEDRPTPQDLAAIDDSFVEEDQQFSHLAINQQIHEIDDAILESKVRERKFRTYANPTGSADELALEQSLHTAYPVEYPSTPLESRRSEYEKRRAARKRVRSWKLKRQRIHAKKRAKILFL